MRKLAITGKGGVGKTTLAAAMAVDRAADGHDTLVMTFDPSLRLKDALGVAAEPEALLLISPHTARLRDRFGLRSGTSLPHLQECREDSLCSHVHGFAAKPVG